MFAENKKLSLKQFERMFLIEIFGTFSLTMPTLVTRGFGYNGIYAFLFGILLAGIYLLGGVGGGRRLMGGWVFFDSGLLVVG